MICYILLIGIDRYFLCNAIDSRAIFKRLGMWSYNNHCSKDFGAGGEIKWYTCIMLLSKQAVLHTKLQNILLTFPLLFFLNSIFKTLFNQKCLTSFIGSSVILAQNQEDNTRKEDTCFLDHTLLYQRHIHVHLQKLSFCDIVGLW